MAVSGIEKTLRTLLRSTNPAATDLLVGALDSEHAAVHQGAVRALALRDDARGHRALAERFDHLPEDARAALADVPSDAPLSRSLPNLIKGAQLAISLSAARMADLWGDAKALPATADAALGPHAASIADFAPIVARLAERLDAETVAYRAALAAGRPHPDPSFVKRAAINALSPALTRFQRYRRSEFLDALLMFIAPDDPNLEACLAEPEHPAFEELTTRLQTTQHPNTLALLSRALADPRAGSHVRAIAAGRIDEPAIEAIYARLGDPIGSVTRDVSSSVDAFAWLEPENVPALLSVSELAQAAAIQVAAASSASRRTVADAVVVLLEKGKPQGRRAACRAITNLPAHTALEPLRVALKSDDSAVLAVAAKLAPIKQYPHATAELIRLAKHGSEAVQKAAHAGLSGVSLSRFREHAESLSEEDRRRVGSLVGQADPMAPATLRAELAAGAVNRRMRALELVELTDLAEPLAPELIERAADTDAGVRGEALRLLAGTPLTDESRAAFERALGDASPSVRSQAEAALASEAKELAPR